MAPAPNLLGRAVEASDLGIRALNKPTFVRE
jgi:hypothetical protein